MNRTLRLAFDGRDGKVAYYSPSGEPLKKAFQQTRIDCAVVASIDSAATGNANIFEHLLSIDPESFQLGRMSVDLLNGHALG